jgi:transcriptional regulator with XRE-family HTH domain
VPYRSRQVRKHWPVVKRGKKRPTTLEQACGQTIVHYREKLGLSQMDLAVATGYSLRYVGDIERGAKSATLRTMNDLSTLFKVRLGSLITEAETLLSSQQRDDKTPSTGRGKSSKRRV